MQKSWQVHWPTASQVRHRASAKCLAVVNATHAAICMFFTCDGYDGHQAKVWTGRSQPQRCRDTSSPLRLMVVALPHPLDFADFQCCDPQVQSQLQCGTTLCMVLYTGREQRVSTTASGEGNQPQGVVCQQGRQSVCAGNRRRFALLLCFHG